TSTPRLLTLFNPGNPRYTFQTVAQATVPPAPVSQATHVFLDFAGGTVPTLPGVHTVAGATGLVHPGFDAFAGSNREDEIETIVQAVRAEFAPYPVQVIRDDNWTSNALLGPGDTVILVGGDGSWLVGANPVTDGGTVRWTAGYAPWDPGNTS